MSNKVRKNYRFHEDTVSKISELLNDSERLFGHRLTETMLLEWLVRKEYIDNSLKKKK